MLRKSVVLIVGLFAMIAMSAVAAPAQAASHTWCDPHSSTSGGRCITVSKPKYHEIYVDTIPIRNKTKKIKVHAYCKWSDTATWGMKAGAEVSASIEGKIFGLAKATAGVTLHTEVSMSASLVREVAGDFVLKPGQTVFCHRTVGYYSFTTVISEWNTTKSWKKTMTSKVPYTMGATFGDR